MQNSRTETYVLATAGFGAKATECAPLNARGALVVKADAEARRERTATANFILTEILFVFMIPKKEKDVCHETQSCLKIFAYL